MSDGLSERAWSIALKNAPLASEFVDQYAGEGIQLREGGKRYKGSRPLIVANREDFDQASLLGLARGAEKWVAGNGALSTYVAYYVHEELNRFQRLLRQANETSLDEGVDRDEWLPKQAARKRLAEGDHAPSAEDESLGTNHSHTKGEALAGVGQPAMPSAPEDATLKLENASTVRRRERLGRAPPRRSVVQPPLRRNLKLVVEPALGLLCGGAARS